MQPKLVIFDCDGVLVDSERMTNEVIQRSLASHGFDLPVDQIMALFVGGTMASVREEVGRRGVQLPHDWVTTINASVAQVLGASVELIPSILGVLDALDAAGIPYAVGSNGPMDKMQATLGRTGLWDRMQGRIYTAHDCDHPKPAPDVYLKAATKAGCDPADCVVIEDSASGAKAAVAAKMPCYGYCADTPAAKLDPFCVATFDDMADLPKFLEL